MIWQTMMGTSGNPKPAWNFHDEVWQHFSQSTGARFEARISPGDLLVIYWPGWKAYMGVSFAAEPGPYRLTMVGEKWDQVRRHYPDVVHWPFGLRIRDLVKIPDPRNGVTLDVARQLLKPPTIPGRRGCLDLTGWKGIEDLIALIRERA